MLKNVPENCHLHSTGHQEPAMQSTNERISLYLDVIHEPSLLHNCFQLSSWWLQAASTSQKQRPSKAHLLTFLHFICICPMLCAPAWSASVEVGKLGKMIFSILTLKFSVIDSTKATEKKRLSESSMRLSLLKRCCFRANKWRAKQNHWKTFVFGGPLMMLDFLPLWSHAHAKLQRWMNAIDRFDSQVLQPPPQQNMKMISFWTCQINLHKKTDWLMILGHSGSVCRECFISILKIAKKYKKSPISDASTVGKKY